MLFLLLIFFTVGRLPKDELHSKPVLISYMKLETYGGSKIRRKTSILKTESSRQGPVTQLKK